VQVHMFDPVDTHDPTAPHINIPPGQCYCYKLDIPSDHPVGMYWYHPHLHGSAAIQMWSGMLGLLYVGKHTLEKELQKYNVRNTHEFVIWDPAFQYVPNQPTHDLEVDEFLLGQTTLSKIHPFLVNGQINPTFTTKVGQVLHFHALCATVENENTFIVYPEGKQHLHWNDDQAKIVPFYQIGSDGVMYSKPIKRNVIVMSGGQREELLLIFDKPGRYVISQQGIQGMQFFGMRGHPHDQILATIVVTEELNDDDKKKEEVVRPTVPIPSMTFTPGYTDEESVQPENIQSSETITFSMGANFDQIPFPQYYINGHSFSSSRSQFHAQPNEAREYVLINANHNAHPFHMHVNRFQIKEMGSELSREEYPVLNELLDFDENIWRDTVMVPPNGRARIWVQFKNYTGKTVIHCHFLAHEDTGMMATLFIGKKDWIFQLEEHYQWMMGVGIGICLSCLVMYVSRCCLGRQRNLLKKNNMNDEDDDVLYSAVSLNELKSKAMD